DVQAECVLPLAGYFSLEYIQMIAADRLMPPTSLKDVVIGIEAERAVDLLAFKRVCCRWLIVAQVVKAAVRLM
ncbi:MAG TPA: hypothetical protein VGS62_01650, partial [Streptosporangiaceae bacterium]|nr:hypothetical protein [Streptosporangiaceae bacterium]